MHFASPLCWCILKKNTSLKKLHIFLRFCRILIGKDKNISEIDGYLKKGHCLKNVWTLSKPVNLHKRYEKPTVCCDSYNFQLDLNYLSKQATDLWTAFPLDIIIVALLVKKYLAFYETRRLFAVLTRIYRVLSWISFCKMRFNLPSVRRHLFTFCRLKFCMHFRCFKQ
jgi:hypothetical protein